MRRGPEIRWTKSNESDLRVLYFLYAIAIRAVFSTDSYLLFIVAEEQTANLAIIKTLFHNPGIADVKERWEG